MSDKATVEYEAPQAGAAEQAGGVIYAVTVVLLGTPCAQAGQPA